MAFVTQEEYQPFRASIVEEQKVRMIVFRSSNPDIGVISDPNTAGNPILDNAPTGSIYLRDSTDGVSYRRRTADTDSWVEENILLGPTTLSELDIPVDYANGTDPDPGTIWRTQDEVNAFVTATGGFGVKHIMAAYDALPPLCLYKVRFSLAAGTHYERPGQSGFLSFPMTTKIFVGAIEDIYYEGSLEIVGPPPSSWPDAPFLNAPYNGTVTGNNSNPRFDYPGPLGFGFTNALRHFYSDELGNLSPVHDIFASINGIAYCVDNLVSGAVTQARFKQPAARIRCSAVGDTGSLYFNGMSINTNGGQVFIDSVIFDPWDSRTGLGFVNTDCVIYQSQFDGWSYEQASSNPCRASMLSFSGNSDMYLWRVVNYQESVGAARSTSVTARLFGGVIGTIQNSFFRGGQRGVEILQNCNLTLRGSVFSEFVGYFNLGLGKRGHIEVLNGSQISALHYGAFEGKTPELRNMSSGYGGDFGVLYYENNARHFRVNAIFNGCSSDLILLGRSGTFDQVDAGDSIAYGSSANTQYGLRASGPHAYSRLNSGQSLAGSLGEIIDADGVTHTWASVTAPNPSGFDSKYNLFERDT